MNDNLITWAKKVIEQVTPLAIKRNKDFYPLQSEIKLNPKIFLLGLNPKGSNDYKSQLQNLDWEFVNGEDAEGNKIKKMTPERLLNGNPSYDINSNDWKFLQGLNRISYFKNILEEKNYVFGNYYFLSTLNFQETQNHKIEIETCKSLIFELINIIKPELIVVLGTANGIDALNEFQKEKETILTGYNQRLLISSLYQGETPVLAIPHPSRMAITQDECNAINTNIEELIQKKPLTKFKFNRGNRRPFNIDEFKANLHSEGFSKLFQLRELGKKQYDCILENDKDRLLIRIDVKGMYFGVRDNTPKTSTKPDRFHATLERGDSYITAFADPKIQKSNSWLIVKNFRDYQSTSLEDLYKAMAKEFRQLEKIVSEGLSKESAA